MRSLELPIGPETIAAAIRTTDHEVSRPIVEHAPPRGSLSRHGVEAESIHGWHSEPAQKSRRRDEKSLKWAWLDDDRIIKLRRSGEAAAALPALAENPKLAEVG